MDAAEHAEKVILIGPIIIGLLGTIPSFVNNFSTHRLKPYVALSIILSTLITTYTAFVFTKKNFCYFEVRQPFPLNGPYPLRLANPGDGIGGIIVVEFYKIGMDGRTTLIRSARLEEGCYPVDVNINENLDSGKYRIDFISTAAGVWRETIELAPIGKTLIQTINIAKKNGEPIFTKEGPLSPQ